MLAQAYFRKTVLSIAHVAKPKTPLELKVELVLSFIKVCVKELSIESAAEHVRLHVLDLRKSMIEFFSQDKLTVNKYSDDVNQYVANDSPSPYTALKKKLNEVIIAQDKIFMALADKIGFEEFGQSTSASANDLLGNYPQEAIERWVEASIDLEFSLIAADLVLEGELSIGKSKVRELTRFMDRTLCRYGGFTIFFKLWETDYEHDHSRFTTNMRILASKYSFDYRMNLTTYSKDELYNILHN